MGPRPKYLKSGHVIEDVDDETNAKIQRCFPTYSKSIRVKPGNWFFEEHAASVLEAAQDFEYRPDDIIAMSFPKSGTTWTQEIIWTLVHNPNLDNPDATKSYELRSPELESDLFILPPKAPKVTDNSEMIKTIRKLNIPVRDNLYVYSYLQHMPGQRVIKTHLSLSLLPKNTLEATKIVYVARDPRDVIASRYNFLRLMTFHNFCGTFEDYLDLFLDEALLFNPYWPHLKEAWELRNHPNFLFLKFEDMKKCPIKEYEKIMKFLNLNLSKEQLEKIVEHTDFGSMKNRSEKGVVDHPMSDGGRFINKDVKTQSGGFFRKGKVGDWTRNFTDEQVERVVAWIRKNTENFPDDFPYIMKD